MQVDWQRLSQQLHNPRVSWTPLEDGTGVVIDLGSKQVLTLNESAAFLVGRLVDGETSEAELRGLLVAAFEVSEDQAASDLIQFGGELERLLLPALAAGSRG